MIYTDVQLKEKIIWLINEFESEVVNLKKQRPIIHLMKSENISLRLVMRQIFVDFRKHGWVFGISNDKKFIGTGI